LAARTARSHGRQIAYYLLAGLAFLAGMATKEIVAIVPFLVILVVFLLVTTLEVALFLLQE